MNIHLTLRDLHHGYEGGGILKYIIEEKLMRVDLTYLFAIAGLT